MPQNWGNGEFSVLVTVAQVGDGQAEINPKEVSAVYPIRSTRAFVGLTRAENWIPSSEEEARQLGERNMGGDGPPPPKIDPEHPPVFLKHAIVKKGSTATGYVFIRKPKARRASDAQCNS